MSAKMELGMSALFLLAGLIAGLIIGGSSGYIIGKTSQVNSETSAVSPTNIKMEGRVTKNVDGDTLDIEGLRINLALVVVPEVGEPGFEEAAQFTSAICPVGSTAKLDVDDGKPTDKYGRTVGVVYCDGKNLNAQLWKMGYAKIDGSQLKFSEFDPYTDW